MKMRSELRAVTARYCEMLVLKAESLRVLIMRQRAANAPPSCRDLQSIACLIADIRGGSGTFGFHEVFLKADWLEHAICDMGDSSNHSKREMVMNGLRDLVNAITSLSLDSSRLHKAPLNSFKVAPATLMAAHAQPAGDRNRKPFPGQRDSNRRSSRHDDQRLTG